jgi:hypothetical protein
VKHRAKHFCYAVGWKKFEPLWDLVIRARQLRAMTPVLEGVLSKVSGGMNGSSRNDERLLQVSADPGRMSREAVRP